jgi:hypothetical protein
LRREGLPEGRQEWLEALADEYPDEEWVVKAAYPEGRIEFEPETWHGLYWEAWDALRFDRQYGVYGGQSPLSYKVITEYADDNNILGEDRWLFRMFMTAIDAEWLKFVAKRDEKPDEKGGKTDG